MRKSVLFGIIVFMIFTLVGCKEEPVLENEYMLKYSDKDVIDSSEVYTVDEDSLPIYHYLEDDTVSYVDIEEFASFLKGGLLNYNVEKEDVLLLDFRQIVPETIKEIIGEEIVIYEISFNHEENTIYTSDLDIFTRLNLIQSISTNGDVSLTDVEKNEVDSSVVIDLDDYNFDIKYENNRYYIPFYLANLFLTGASINIYETDDAFIVFDYGTDTSSVRDHYTSSSLTLEDVRETTTNYLALYFDYFYGLKEDKEIESFKDLLDEYNLEETNNFIDYYELVSDFMFDLNDLHTRIMDTGHLMPNYEPEDNFLYGSKVNKYSQAYTKSRCADYPGEFTYTLINSETHFVQIPGFEGDTGDSFGEIASYIRPGEDLIIDVTCNTGGSLQGVVELLLHLTEEPVPVRHINSKTNHIVEEFYESDIEALVGVDIFIVTSEVTYSAANVFVSAIRDLELGTIIGDNSLGGSCALVFTVLPNGLIISNSSYMTFIDENHEINEDGIEVDIEYQLPYDAIEIAQDVKSYFDIGTEYYIDIVDLLVRSRIIFDIMYQDDVIDVVKYVLTISVPNGEVVFTQTYQDEFTLRQDFELPIAEYDIEIFVEYEYNSVTYEEVVFYQEGSSN